MDWTPSATRLSKKRARSYTETCDDSERPGRKSNYSGHRVKFRHKRVTQLKRNRVAGVRYRLQRKIEKVITHTKNYGQYTWISSNRLRQTQVDRYGIISTDWSGLELQLFVPRQFIDAASICWNSKTPAQNWTNATNNISDDTTINIINSYCQLYFKSTSSHVVNLEIYEMTAKVANSALVLTQITNSYNNVVNRYYNGAGNNAIDAGQIGTTGKEWVELYKNFKIKCHKVKLIPGESSSLFIQGFKNRAMDLTKCQNNGALETYMVGSKCLYIRALNDPTVSNVDINGYVHHWPSNSFGGVAMEIRHVYRMTPPNNIATSASNAQNTIIIGDWQHVVNTEGDQQVVYENPITTTSGP